MAKRKAKLQPSLWDVPTEQDPPAPSKPLATNGATAYVNDWYLDMDENIDIVGVEFETAIGSTMVEVTPRKEATHAAAGLGGYREFHSIALVTILPKNGQPMYARHIFIEPSTGDIYLSGKVDPVTDDPYLPQGRLKP